MIDEQLITVATSYNIVEAEFLRNHLEAEGYRVFLADDYIIGIYNLLANAVGGIKIKVPANESQAATAFVEGLRRAEIVEEGYVPGSWKGD